MENPIARIALLIVCFGVSMLGLSALNYEKLLKPGHTWQAQLLYIVGAMALAWLLYSFITGLLYKPF